MFNAVNPINVANTFDALKGIKDTSDTFKQGSTVDKRFAVTKLASTFVGMLPGKYGLMGSISSMHLNAAENMRNPSLKGFVDLGFDVAKLATTFHPGANLVVRGTEVVKDSFVHCYKHPQEFSAHRALPAYHPDHGGFTK